MTLGVQGGKARRERGDETRRVQLDICGSLTEREEREGLDRTGEARCTTSGWPRSHLTTRTPVKDAAVRSAASP